MGDKGATACVRQLQRAATIVRADLQAVALDGRSDGFEGLLAGVTSLGGACREATNVGELDVSAAKHLCKAGRRVLGNVAAVLQRMRERDGAVEAGASDADVSAFDGEISDLFAAADADLAKIASQCEAVLATMATLAVLTVDIEEAGRTYAAAAAATSTAPVDRFAQVVEEACAEINDAVFAIKTTAVAGGTADESDEVSCVADAPLMRMNSMSVSRLIDRIHVSTPRDRFH